MAEVAFKESAKHLALDAVMTFGQFKGRTVKDVADEKPTYLVWAIKNIGWFEITREARKYAQRRLCEAQQRRIDHMAYAGILPDSPDDGENDDDEDSGWPEMANYHDSDCP